MPQRQPAFHTGERQSSGDAGALQVATAEIRHHVSTAGSPEPSGGFAARRLRSARPLTASHLCSRCPCASLYSATGKALAGPPSGRSPLHAALSCGRGFAAFYGRAKNFVRFCVSGSWGSCRSVRPGTCAPGREGISVFPDTWARGSWECAVPPRPRGIP